MHECCANIVFKFQSFKSKVGLGTSSDNKDSILVPTILDEGLQVN